MTEASLVSRALSPRQLLRHASGREELCGRVALFLDLIRKTVRDADPRHANLARQRPAREDHRFDPAVEAAFASARVLVVELDLRALTAAGTSGLVLERGRLPDDQSLDALVSEATWSELAALLAEHGQSAELYRGFKPWVAMVSQISASVRPSKRSALRSLRLSRPISRCPAAACFCFQPSRAKKFADCGL